MKILGISAFYHDSAAALIEDGVILAAAQEERFTRKKHDPAFPAHAVRYCLDEAACSINDLDAVVFYDKPLLKFERLLETYYSFAPRGVKSFIAAMPVWLKEKMFLKRLIYQELAEIGEYDKKQLTLLFPEHHLSHAASAFYPSPFDESAIITIDGVGEWATASVCHGKGKDITILKELTFPHSLGLLYSSFTYFLGFRVNSGEYKLMGLAPYGNSNSDEVKRFERIIREELIDIKEDGSVWLDQKKFSYATGLTMADDALWSDLFGFDRRTPETPINQAHCDLALAIQNITEEIVLKMAADAQKQTGCRNICLAGGVALNCVANGKLLKSKLFDGIYIQPAAGDAGGSLGAALAAHHIYFDQPREALTDDLMQGAYLGPEIQAYEIEKLIRRYKAKAVKLSDNILFNLIAVELAAGKVAGWVQGRMEFGPRALGNRSILGDPRSGEMQKKLNLKIKYRESFRPFAPSVLTENVSDIFDLNVPSPYMLIVAPVQEKLRNPLPEDYHVRDLRGKLYEKRSELPAITHVDYSARVQTVSEKTNPRYHRLISAFKEKTGFGVLVNTSFNVRGEPIVCTADDAYRCFMRTEMDILVIGNHLFYKTDQPEWPEGKEWEEEFTLD